MFNNLKIFFTLIIICLLFHPAISLAESGKLDYGDIASFVEIHGIIVQEYHDFEDEGRNNGVNTFDSRFAYLFIESSVRDNLKGVLEWKFDHAGESIMVDRVYLDWKLNKFLSLKMGKYYLPLLPDVREIRPANNKFVSYGFPGPVQADIFRDVGIMAYGQVDLYDFPVSYKASLSNGSLFGDIRLSNSGKYHFFEETDPIDSDNDKAITLKLSVEPVSNIDLSGSYLHVSFDTKMIMTVPVDLGSGIIIPYDMSINLGRFDINIFLFSPTYKSERFHAQAMLMDGTVKSETIEKRTGLNLYRAQASYKIINNTKHLNFVELSARFQKFQMNINNLSTVFENDNIDTRYISLGLNVSPYKHFVLKAQYDIEDEIVGADYDNNGYWLQAVIDF